MIRIKIKDILGFAHLTVALLCVELAISQQNIFPDQKMESVVVDESGRVTFSYINSIAKEVFVVGDFIKSNGLNNSNRIRMAKKNDSLWSITTESLKPEFYSYMFMVGDIPVIDPNNPFVFRDFSTISNGFIVKNGTNDYYSVNDVPHGTVSNPWYYSRGAKKSRRLSIYTPPGYETTVEKYPVLYLLHGAGGDEEEWLVFGRVAEIMDNLISSGKAKPMIVVMPNGHFEKEAAPGKGSLGLIKPEGPSFSGKWGEFEINFPEIMEFAEKTFRIDRDKTKRAIAGLSMGGAQTATISAYFENTFDYIGVFSSAQGIIPYKAPFSNYDSLLTNQVKNGVKLYWLGIGKDDFLLKPNQRFRNILDEHGMDYYFIETDEGHIWKNWRKYLVDFAQRIF